MKPTKEALIAQRREINEAIGAIELAEAIKANKPMVGKYFRARESVPSGKSWWLYLKITSIDKDGILIGHQFSQEPNFGMTARHISFMHASHLASGGFKVIRRQQYFDAFLMFRATLAELFGA